MELTISTECLQRCVISCFTPPAYPEVAQSNANVHVVVSYSSKSWELKCTDEFCNSSHPFCLKRGTFSISPFHVKKCFLGIYSYEIYIFFSLCLAAVCPLLGNQIIKRRLSRKVGNIVGLLPHLIRFYCFLIAIVEAYHSFPTGKLKEPSVKVRFLFSDSIYSKVNRVHVFHPPMTATNENWI